jgi:hypothetical protein
LTASSIAQWFLAIERRSGQWSFVPTSVRSPLDANVLSAASPSGSEWDRRKARANEPDGSTGGHHNVRRVTFMTRGAVRQRPSTIAQAARLKRSPCTNRVDKTIEKQYGAGCPDADQGRSRHDDCFD